ncbi:hypothetical protein TELCIR_13398, partial [Teladorsagia circumcincta]
MKSAVFLLLVGATVLGHRRRHHEECHRAPPKPKFLKSVSCKARVEYFDIVLNMREPIAKQSEEVLEWAKKYKVEEQVEEFNNSTADFIEELKQNVTTLVAELPAALEMFLNITQNKDQSRLEMKKALKEMRAQGFEVFDALKAAFKVFKPRHCLHRRQHEDHGSQDSEELADEWMNEWEG